MVGKQWVVGGVGLWLVIGLGWWRYRQTGDLKTTGMRIPVRLALKWTHQAQFAGFYQAQVGGEYHKQGLEVNFIPFDLKNQPIDLVINDQAEFGVCGAEELLLAIESGKPAIAIAAIFQNTPLVLYTNRAEIMSLADMKGKKIGVQNIVNANVITRAMFENALLDPDTDVKRMTIGFGSEELVAGEVDVAAGYAIDQPLEMEEQGLRVKTFRAVDNGVDLYGDILFTKRSRLTQQSELVAKMIQGSLWGWNQVATNPDLGVMATLNYLAKSAPEVKQHQGNIMQAMKMYIQPSVGAEIGQMSAVKWLQSIALLKRYRVIKDHTSLDQVYSSQFVDNYYRE